MWDGAGDKERERCGMVAGGGGGGGLWDGREEGGTCGSKA